MAEEGEATPELQELRSQWLAQAMTENPQFLAMRERTLNKTGGLSFANVIHTTTTTSLSTVNRNALLELVYQHLRAIGMNKTADVLIRESGHTFQNSDQPWDRTDLHLLVSLALSHREDPWDIAPDPSHNYVQESIEEDFFSSPYRENPDTIWEELLDPMVNSVYDQPTNPSFGNLKRTSLKRLVVLLTTQQGSRTHLSDPDMQLIFLSLHSMTSSDHFLRLIVTLFDGNCPEKYKDKIDSSLLSEIRKNACDVIRKWTIFHGRFIGKRTLKSIGQFLERVLNDSDHKIIHRYVVKSLTNLPNLKYGMSLGTPSPKENDIKKPEILFSPNLTLLMPEPADVAKQISRYQGKVFASVHSLEFIIAMSNRACTIQTPTLNEFFLFDHHLQCLLLDALLKEDSYKDGYKKMIDIALQFRAEPNMDALAVTVRLLRREDVKKLGEATEEQIKLLEELWDFCGKDGEDMNAADGHQTTYEEQILFKFDDWATCIPNMTAELQAIDSATTSQPDFIDGLINWEKRRKIAERAAILYRFQNQSTFVEPISQIQKVISSVPTSTFDQLIKTVSDKIAEKG